MNATAARDLDVAGLLTRCGVTKGFPPNARVAVAVAAHRQAFAEDKALASMVLRAIVCARTPDVQDYRDQLEYLAALPLDAWENRPDTPENIRAATLAMIERELEQAIAAGEDRAVSS
jgi:hypothetical protein